MKKILTLMLAATLTLTASTIFTSCSDQDDLGLQSTQTQAQATANADFAKQLVGTRLDLSNILLGSNELDVWKIKQDGTLTLYKISPSQDEKEDQAVTDSVQGTWEAFSNIDDPWDATGMAPKRSGFFATFKGTEAQKFGSSEDELKLTYFAEKMEDDSLYVISRDYISFMYMKYGGYAMPSRSITSSISNRMKDLYNTVVRSDIFRKMFGVLSNIYGGRFLTYNNVESEKFGQTANEAIKEMQKMAGMNQTDYSHWMGDIYGNANPRICDMNIPGTHDSFTYGIKFFMTAKYASCQRLDLDKQWKAGIRAFDVRFKENGGIYHGLSTGITVPQVMDELVKKLTANPKETAIVFLQSDGDDTSGKHKAIVEIMKKYKDHIVTSPRPDLRLDECRGKVLLFQAWDYNNDHPEERVAPTMKSIYNNGGKSDIYYFRGKSDLYNYDLADKTTAHVYYQNKCQQGPTELRENFWKEKKKLMEECFVNTANTLGKDEPIWAVNMASGNVGGLGFNMSYSMNANVMNPYTFSYVVTNKEKKMNIIMMDYAGYNDTKEGYNCNGGKLPEAIVLTNKFIGK